MDIQVVIDGIVDAGRQEITSIEKKASSQVSAIHEKAKTEANHQKDRILKDSRVRLNRTKAVIDQRATMQALQMHANARQNLIMMVLEKTKDELLTIREKPTYRTILEKLVNDAIFAILPSLKHEQKIILHMSQLDKPLIQSIDFPCVERVEVRFDSQCSGGCEAESDDGQVRVLNTFESRFDRALPKIQQDLSRFFEEKIASS